MSDLPCDHTPRNPKTLISHKVRRSPKSNIRPIPGRHRLWLRLGRTGGTTRPVKARAHRPVEGAKSTCAHPGGGPIDPTQAAAGTGLALNGSSLRDLDCTHSNYRTREPDQPGSIPRETADASTAPDRESPQHRAGGIDGQAKVEAIRLRLRIQPSPSGLPHSHGSMNTFVRPAFEHTGVRLSGRENKRGRARLCPPITRFDTGPATGFKGTIHQRRAALGGKNTQAPGECQRPNKAAGGPCSEGKTARRDDGSSAEKHHSRMSSEHHFRRSALQSAAPMPGPCMASQQQSAIGARTVQSQDRGGGTERSRRGVKDQKLELGKRV
ncbi:hypothetical protein H6P81_021338 [Aristolochia fimbriata]|uniref:Uncharacterized protein n=1 Tax=Aristolochia fimbriata TaxID=158543 RepID=A0AAV7DQ90_ARIFI|nr:hypothetical protein H6P81_021338 [Aristolochia fimbriata]